MENFKILIVDDTSENIEILGKLLSEYRRYFALNGEKGIELARNIKPDLILLDIKMPGMDGYEVCSILKKDKTTSMIPVIFITALNQDSSEEKGLKLGAVDYITKPFNPALVRVRVKNNLELKKYRDSLETLVEERTHQLELTQEVTIRSLASLAETRDNETGQHLIRTQNYTRMLAEKLKEFDKYKRVLTKEMLNDIYKSTPLHDIGKVGVPDNILLKPGKLTDEEFEEMKKHTIYGRDAIQKAAASLGENSFLSMASVIAYTHHEKWDGSGYPQNLAGEAIPLSGRIMAVADVYDALISRRVYKEAFLHEKAVEIIMSEKGTHFDPLIVDVFFKEQNEFRRIAQKYKDSGDK